MTSLLSAAMLLGLAFQPAPKLSLEAPQKVLRPGGRMPMRFTIENEKDVEDRIEEPENYLEGLEIRDFEDRVLKVAGRTRGITKRTIAVEAGGFLGRTVDIASVLDVPADREGWYRIKWSFGDATSAEVRVLVLRSWQAAIETNSGVFTLEFMPEVAPNHVLRFLGLARSGFYDGSSFHRVIPGFMMQGGAPKDPKNEVKTPLQAEFSDVKHVFGTVSMARTHEANSALSQFFVCFDTAPHLDGNYSAFARVVAGEDVVREIEKVKTDHDPCRGCKQVPTHKGPNACCGKHHGDKPENEVIIKKITLNERKP